MKKLDKKAELKSLIDSLNKNYQKQTVEEITQIIENNNKEPS